MPKKPMTQKQTKPERRAVVYVRVDPDEGEPDASIHRSVELQRYFGIGFARCLGASVVDTHVEIGAIGPLGTRPVLQKMLQRVEADRGLLVIAEDDSILADPTEIGQLCAQLNNASARLVTINRLTEPEKYATVATATKERRS